MEAHSKMNPTDSKLMLMIIATLAFAIPPEIRAASSEVIPPAANETLILIYRDNAFGHGYKHWIAVNDKTVAFVKEKRYATIRAKAGAITLNLASMGNVLDSVQLDDRPGEIVYLRWKMGGELREMSAEEAEPLSQKFKSMEPMDEVLPNKEQVAVLINPSRLVSDLMQPTMAKLETDDETAVITFFRRGEKTKYDLGVWDEKGIVGSLGRNQGVEIKIRSGEYFFLAGNVGTSLLKASVEPGKRYYVWLDYGKMIGRVRLTPVSRDKSGKLSRWLKSVEMVSLNPDSLTTRFREREEIVADYVRDAAARAKSGTADAHELDGRHAY
jgi:hypothetical protein